MNKKFMGKVPLILFLFFITILQLNSCKQYEYSSPTPGLIEIKLRAVYTQFETDFSNHNFTIKISEISAYRSDGYRARIYEDEKAIIPSDPRPDIYNLLGRSAYDSSLVIGRYYLPPASYDSLVLLVEPGNQVILDGYRYIGVEPPKGTAFITSVSLKTPFDIEEAKKTTIVLTVDLDASLKKLAETFEYVPRFYISSIVKY